MNDAYTAKETTAALLDVLKAQGLCLKEALRPTGKAEKMAESIHVPMVITVVNQGGNMVAMHRMDDSLLANVSISCSKAYTAAVLRASAEDAARDILPGQPLYGLQQTYPGRFCTFGGGLPIMEYGSLIGGLGVSGGTVERDMAVARYALLAD